MVSISPVNLRILILQILVGLFTLISFLKLGHYLVYPTYFIFDSPSAVQLAQGQIQKTFQTINYMEMAQNLLLFALFYVQHIVMAKLKFKIIASKKWANFPIYERIIYNLTSAILLIIVLDFQKPQTISLFSISPIVCYPLALIGIGLVGAANMQMEQSIIFPYKFQQLLSLRQVKLKQNNYQNVEEEGITIKGAYSLVRHPMQGGVGLLLTFGNPLFTVEKLFILTTIIVFIVIGVKMQEQRLLKKFKQYKGYSNIVTKRFIPYLI